MSLTITTGADSGKGVAAKALLPKFYQSTGACSCIFTHALWEMKTE